MFSLVNPHDVLGYPGLLPARRLRGARSSAASACRCRRASTRTCARSPPCTRSRGWAWTTTSARSPDLQAKQDYVDFYAYLHRVVDRQIGRLLRALGPPEEEDSLRSRTIVIRTSDHGEMGLSHGGLRQKIFNAYEETIRVPLVISNPRLFPQPRESDALVSLLDILPTFLGIAGPGNRPQALDGEDLAPLIYGHAAAVRDAVLFTYDDHQAGTALQEASGQPNRVRCVRDERFKYAVYLDPDGRAQPEYELYDLHEDPLEMRNLVEVRGGRPRERRHEELRERMAAILARLCTDSGTLSPRLPA